MDKTEPTELWLPIIGRALAFLCVQSHDLREEAMGAKVKFLDGLGLPRKDTAALLGTTEGSVRGLLSYADKSRKRKTKSARKE